MCTVCGCGETVLADGKPISHDEAHRLGFAHSHARAVFSSTAMPLPFPHVHALGHGTTITTMAGVLRGYRFPACRKKD